MIDALPSLGSREVQKPQFGKVKQAAPVKSNEAKDRPMEGTVTCILADERQADPLLLIGFESGAIGMFKLLLEKTSHGNKTINVVRLFSAQKLIQDIKVKHVLSFALT